MKTRKILPYVGAGLMSLFFLACPAKAEAAEKKNFYAYISVNQANLNPEAYNRKIKEVSVGDVFGPVIGYSAGIERRVKEDKDIWAGIEIGKNSQSKDAVKEEIATGKKTVFGKNLMELTNIDPYMTIKTPVAKNTSLEASIGPAITRAYLESQNEVEKISSTSMLYGAKFSLSLCQKVQDYFIKGTLSSRTASINGVSNLNASADGYKISVGREF